MSGAAPRFGPALFTRVAPRYDLMKWLLSFGAERRWKARALERLVGGRRGRCLDLATGTGDIVELLRRSAPGLRCVGVDANRAMLRRADGRTGGRVVGDLNTLPFSEACCDVITMGYALRYVADLSAFFAALRRLLRPGGAVFAFDVGMPRGAALRAAWMGYLCAMTTAIGLALHARPDTYWHLPASLRAYPGQDAVASLLRAAGFARVEVVDIAGGTLAAHLAVRGD